MIPDHPRQMERGRIPILTTAGAALRFLLSNPKPFFFAALIPLLLSQAIWFSAYIFVGGFFDLPIAEFLSILPWTIFTVFWCRFVLLGPQGQTLTILHGWTFRHWRIAAVLLLVWLITAPVGIGVLYLMEEAGFYAGLLVGLFQILLIIAFYGLALRPYLACCGLSVDEPFGPGKAWLFSRGQGFRLLGSVMLALMPVFFVSFIVSLGFESWTGLSPDWPDNYRPPNFDWRLIPFSFVYGVLDYAYLALEVMVLCVVFRQLTGWQPPVANEETLKAFD